MRKRLSQIRKLRKIIREEVHRVLREDYTKEELYEWVKKFIDNLREYDYITIIQKNKFYFNIASRHGNVYNVSIASAEHDGGAEEDEVSMEVSPETTPNYTSDRLRFSIENPKFAAKKFYYTLNLEYDKYK